MLIAQLINIIELKIKILSIQIRIYNNKYIQNEIFNKSIVEGTLHTHTYI